MDWRTFANYAMALVPVLAFLVFLRLMDSYKLVPRGQVVSALCAGGAAAGLSYVINSAVFHYFPQHASEHARLGGPAVEELAKGAYLVFLIATARVAFIVDAGICAFAVGAGFSLVENFYYLQRLEGLGIGVFALRGLGTALMHGGATAIAAMITVFLFERLGRRGWWMYAPGWLAGFAIHAGYNSGTLPPLASNLVVLIGMPVLIAAVFLWSESSLRRWLGDKLDRDIEILSMIATGEFQQSKLGDYLKSLQERFPPAVCGDMLCMLQLTIELSVRAKGDLLLREAGVEVEPDPLLDDQFQELAYLEKSVGLTGMLAVKPLLSQTPRDLWEMRRLAEGR